MKGKITFLFIFILSLQSQAQQAWTSPKGKFYSQIGYTYYPYNGYVDKTNAIIPLDRNIVHNSLQGYLQYGITNRLMATSVLPVTFTKSTLNTNAPRQKAKEGQLNGLSNIELGLTYKIYEKGGFVMSGKVNSLLKSAKNDTLTGLRTGTDAYSVGPSLLMGIGLKKFFSSLEMGYLYRSNDYSSQTIGSFQIGKFMGKKQKLLSIFHTEIRYSNFNGTYNDGNTKYTITYLDNLKYTSLGAKFGYKINKNIMAWTDLRFAAFASQNIGARTKNPLPGMSFSLSYSN
jgi:hypothetical protein